ncbi:MAG: T9SS type A sorting domain-containing protein [Bacteroidetes bacterium]|nr:T9SS type A sorting domain-containing protein [Bacteroidota bacterium]
MRQSIIIILIIFITELKAQEPVIAWQQTIGGSGLDYFKSCNQTSDNGYIIGGYSYSEISGDKTEGNIGSADYWVLKLDSVGDIEWQNTIGGASTDFLASVEQTFDGGYIIGGYSKSGASGDKTELNFIGGEGYDYWIVKLNALGSIEWQNTIGGNNDDFLVSTHQTMDGGYIIGGYSSSTLSGDKSEGNMGGAGTKDYWILKLNSSGSIIWQNTIGADGNDVLAEIRETAEGNYIVGGYSDSKKNGDKTIKRWGSLSDYWVMQLNSSGTIMWQNVFGGLDSDLLTSVIQLADGGFLFGGYSDSDITGNKSKHLYVGSHTDYWLVKTDALGNIIWDKVLGGSENEIITSMTETAGQNLLIAGYSISPSSFDKLEPTQGLEDYWILELDNSGKTLWENDLGGILNERPYAIGNTQDGGFFVLGYSASLISGDKTEVGSGSIDGWMLKFNPSNCISGPYYFDFDMDNAGDVTTAFNACELTYLYVENSTDCNPLHSNQNPLAPEVCDGIDNNCDGLIDEGIFGCNPGPDVIWQNTIGGVESDNIADIHPTSDGGYILIAGSDSDISGDKNANSKGAIDYWIVKLDAIGNITWQKTIGGSGNDWPKCISQTTDGGYIAGGYSSSGISGDKNEASLGGDDFWIIKLDALGNIEWQNTIGGNSTDLLNDLNQTLDGGFIAGGSSFSGISGDKTTPNAANDGWILKLNATGSIEWQKSIRGNLFDILDNIKQTTDGGYIAGLYSESGIGLDKTAPSQGAYDYWIVKLDASGNIMWQNTIGGGAGDYLYAVSQLSDGSYIVGGTSFSSASGNKTEVLIGGSDLWIVKLDISGNLVWQNTIGGADLDGLNAIRATQDNGFIIGGFSWSDISGDKVENKIIGGVEDAWIMKLNSEGEIVWQNAIGGNNNDFCINIEQCFDGTFIAGVSSGSELSGDKNENTPANVDSWIIKFDIDCVPVTEICNSIDDNCNGNIDENITETISISAGGPTTFCQGGNVLLTAIYSGATVQWKKNGTNIPGATSPTYLVTTKGTYTCETTSICGTATAVGIFVNVNKNPPATITAGGPTNFCAGGSVILTANTGGGLSYQWYKGATPIAGATSLTYTATTSGNYKCRVTKTATGCFKNSNPISVSVQCKEGEDVLFNTTFNIQPNPNNGAFTISANSLSPLETTKLLIYNTTGQQIFSSVLDPQLDLFEINLPEIPTGMYIVKLVSGTSIYEQKLIIE